MASLSSNNAGFQNHDNAVLGKVLDMDMIYKRNISNERIALGKEFTKLYGNKSNTESFMFPSGMNAIMMTLKTIIQHKGSKGIILHGNELYGDTTHKILKNICVEYPNVKCIGFDVKNINEFNKLVEQNRANISILFVESASNPSGEMFDWNTLNQHNKLFSSGQVSVIVDNTWLSSIAFNPFNVGANVVVESCSKYNSGGCAIGGVAIVNSKKGIQSFRNMMSTYGIHMHEQHCKIIHNNLLNLRSRINIIFNKTFNVIIGLNKLIEKINPNVSIEQLHGMVISNKICCAGLQNNPTYAVFHQHIPELDKKGCCAGVFTLRIDGNANSENLCNACYQHDILYATSFGKDEELIDMWPKKKTDSLTIRISVGMNTDVTSFTNKLFQLYNDLHKI
jgi:cystathionine beta-lyase/cystathionine gamma-synthase